MSRNGRRVPGTASPSCPVGPDVERQELRVAPLQACGDEGPVRVDGKVDESALGEKEVVRISAAVLGDGVVGVLAGVGGLQLSGSNGQPVDHKCHVHRNTWI